MIVDIVNGLLETYGTLNPFELCDYMDIKIIYSNLGEEIKGFFQRTPNNYEIIHLNSDLVPEEKKYICAHELGHAILHTDLSMSFFIENALQVKNKYEIQADKFAAELLLYDIESNYEINGLTISQLSSYYGVPEHIIEMKILMCQRNM
ncbi:protein of unknown function [Caloramator quimbayensis]|uniref:IrrE N-terminal-like domain-containing protein n=1 Tax=Caloramator quimbayensis TaxID=1147123 RepID=A0A1T4YED0_9CLOT|nr:ImmA/IrrE family metallo-endopeptidase [Caloramator quimbayensis]SKB00050.1 protein of unknown function [Caloramator quimbayensis]